MENFTPLASALGGILIGISASILMYLNGRIAGISGIISGAFRSSSTFEKLWRLAFLAGLIGGGYIYNLFFPISIVPRESITTAILIIGGITIGIGTSMGSGCTSGHGICGVSRFSLRSILATATFLISGIITVYLVKIILE